MVGRGVLLDVCTASGPAVSGGRDGHYQRGPRRHREGTGVEIRRGDSSSCAPARWSTAGQRGMGPTRRRCAGAGIETAEWIFRKEIAAICTDTWGCEVRPNETTEASQPWHWVVIPMIGIPWARSSTCATWPPIAPGSRLRVLFCAPPLPVTRAVGRLSIPCDQVAEAAAQKLEKAAP